MTVEVFLTYQVSCYQCEAVGVCREQTEELFQHRLALCPSFICRNCNYRMGPGKILLQGLRDKLVNCYSFDCDGCGEFNLFHGEPNEFCLGGECQFCGQLNIFQ